MAVKPDSLSVWRKNSIPFLQQSGHNLRLNRMNRAVFLDRDGTLIAEKNYLHRPEEVKIFPDAFPALQKLTQAGYQLVIVPNQSGIGRGYFTLTDAEKVNAHVAAEFARHGVHFAKTYIAPEA